MAWRPENGSDDGAAGARTNAARAAAGEVRAAFMRARDRLHGGDALRGRKIVAQMAPRRSVTVDGAKVVYTVGAFPPHVQILHFDVPSTLGRIKDAIGAAPVLRGGDTPFLIDSGNFIANCAPGVIDAPESVAKALGGIAGVVEQGLLLTEATDLFAGTPDGVERRTRPS